MRLMSCLTLLLLTSAPAVAAQVYKWKDANGVTQYSATPPPARPYETRPLTRDPVEGATAAPATSTVPAEPPQCTTARQNLIALQGSGAVMQDLDGDGIAETELGSAQRDNQRALAEAAIKAWCTAPG